MRNALIVDDDADALNLMTRYLEPLGFTIEVAFSGREALDKITEQRYDLVISDVRMPNGTGIDLLREIKILKANLPIILISAETIGAKAQAKAMGAYAFMPKPIVKEDFVSLIGSLVGSETHATHA